MPDDAPSPPDVAVTFCATVVDELVRAGVAHAFVAPGSRSTPMALALACDARVSVHVHHDERSAAFAALGAGLASGRPAVVLTTSGTAAAELHAAVVEAHQARVPMIVLTADRPPELRDVGAPQTIDQQHLYGRAVRWFVDPGVADWSTRHTWRSFAARLVLEATGQPPGPVHANLPFREPLLGEPAPLPPGRARGAPWHGRHALRAASTDLVVDRAQRGLVVAGRGARDHARAIAEVGWPVIADPRAGIGGIAHADPLLRTPHIADTLVPEVVLRVGEPPASRIVNEWLDGCGARQLVVAAGWIDPAHVAAGFAGGFRVTGDRPSPRWRTAWTRADAAAEAAIAQELASTRDITEPGVARAVMASAPVGGHVVVASSMPVRDVEWYAPRRTDVTVHANRGANGIDGVVSTAVGVAIVTGAPTIALVGDLAFLHDSTALVALATRRVDLTVVVIDNDGGGIFSFLPQATALAPDRFEQLFGTPHGTDCVALARAHGVDATEVTTIDALERALAARGKPRVVVAKSDRARNVEVHRRLHDAVAAAVATGARARPSSPRA
ncbi:MAG TPA: 2-succinyl-5-enolpyruvyl-6-hydroxy-3-cyclohexene-1-carboxylic-acid synthase [Acidimicrobiales bacterium]